jgi:hypothetical protein
LDYALRIHGFSGSLGDKLKASGPRFSDLNGVWSAHRVRNNIAHDLSDIRVDVLKTALRQYKRALSDLGADL